MSEEPTSHGPDGADPAEASAPNPSPPADDPHEPRQPWPAGHEFGREDGICAALIGIMTLYGLAMIPLRPLLLTQAPFVLAGLGYGAGLAYVGALMATSGVLGWALILIPATAMAVAIASVYWWAGNLWGRTIVDQWAAKKSERTQRRWDKAWDLTHRFAIGAIVLAFIPLPLPMSVMLVAVGAARVRYRTFLGVALLSAGAVKAAWLALGYQLGEPAVQVVEAYAWVLWLMSLAILLGMVGAYVWRKRTRPDAAYAVE